MSNIRVNSIVWVVYSGVKPSTDGVLDIGSECLKEPMPQPFNRCVMNTSNLQHGRKLIDVKLWRVCCPNNTCTLDYRKGYYHLTFTVNLSGWRK